MIQLKDVKFQLKENKLFNLRNILYLFDKVNVLVVKISEMNLDDFYQVVSDYCLHLYRCFHSISADMSSGLLQVFVEHGNLDGTSNCVLLLNPRGSPLLMKMKHL